MFISSSSFLNNWSCVWVACSIVDSSLFLLCELGSVQSAPASLRFLTTPGLHYPTVPAPSDIYFAEELAFFWRTETTSAKTVYYLCCRYEPDSSWRQRFAVVQFIYCACTSKIKCSCSKVFVTIWVIAKLPNKTENSPAEPDFPNAKITELHCNELKPQLKRADHFFVVFSCIYASAVH